jgi:transposase
VRIVLPKNRFAGTTIYGCISNFCSRDDGFLHMFGASTNTQETCSFLTLIRGACILPREERITVVLDNAKAHNNNATKAHLRALNMDALFMPPYSPELNSIETVWGLMKARLKDLIAKDVQTQMLTAQSFQAKLVEALIFGPYILDRAMMYNREAMETHL